MSNKNCTDLKEHIGKDEYLQHKNSTTSNTKSNEKSINSDKSNKPQVPDTRSSLHIEHTNGAVKHAACNVSKHFNRPENQVKSNGYNILKPKSNGYNILKPKSSELVQVNDVCKELPISMDEVPINCPKSFKIWNDTCERLKSSLIEYERRNTYIATPDVNQESLSKKYLSPNSKEFIYSIVKSIEDTDRKSQDSKNNLESKDTYLHSTSIKSVKVYTSSDKTDHIDSITENETDFNNIPESEVVSKKVVSKRTDQNSSTEDLDRGQSILIKNNVKEFKREHDITRDTTNKGHMWANEREEGELATGELEDGELGDGDLNTGEIEEGEIEEDEIEEGEIEEGEMEEGEIEEGEMEEGEIEEGEIEEGEIEEDEMEEGEIEEGEIEEGEIEEGEIEEGEIDESEINNVHTPIFKNVKNKVFYSHRTDSESCIRQLSRIYSDHSVYNDSSSSDSYTCKQNTIKPNLIESIAAEIPESFARGGAYELLGLNTHADHNMNGNIKKSYYQEAKKMHPDKGGDETIMKLLVTAKEILLDKDKQRAYNHISGIEDVCGRRPPRYDDL